MGYNWAKKKMKKMFLICLTMLGFVFVANAQVGTTKAVPISNGCGSESSKASQVGAFIVKPLDAAITGTSIKAQNASCDQHDRDYYNGVDKKKADNDFQSRSPIMGTVVKTAKETSNNSYREAQKDRETSRQLQPTWEKENKQCLDGNNYRVTPNK
ncbi:MAG: hypothetical protein Q4F82_00460 [bacterium]|nr:hypothetical protein [bacterium]